MFIEVETQKWCLMPNLTCHTLNLAILPLQKKYICMCLTALQSIISIISKSLPREQPTLWNSGQFLQSGTAGQVHAINLKAVCKREWLNFWSFMQCSVFLKNKMSIIMMRLVQMSLQRCFCRLAQ